MSSKNLIITNISYSSGNQENVLSRSEKRKRKKEERKKKENVYNSPFLKGCYAGFLDLHLHLTAPGTGIELYWFASLWLG